METNMKFRQLTCSKHLILALALSLTKGKAVHNSPNFKPKFKMRAKMDKNHFQEIKQQFSE